MSSGASPMGPYKRNKLRLAFLLEPAPQHVSALLLLDPACVLALLCFSFLTYTEMHKGDSLCFFKEKQLCSSCPLEPRPACILEPRPACLLEPRPTNNERSLAPHVFWSLAPHVFWSLAPQSTMCKSRAFHHGHLYPSFFCCNDTMKEREAHTMSV